MNIGDASIQKEVSCRVTNSVIKYLESRGYNTEPLFGELPLPYTKEYLTNPANWVTYDIREQFCRQAAELTGDDAVMYKVGLATPILNPLGGVENIIRGLTGPIMVYRFLPRYSRLFDRVFRFETTITDKNTARVKMITEQTVYKPSKDSCYFAQGILAAIPTLWSLAPAQVREICCMHNPAPSAALEGVKYNAAYCEYEVQWQSPLSWVQRLRDNILGKLTPVSANFEELEESLRLSNQKNTELLDRNNQLAAVREIAISIDKVRTLDEALTLTVEQSREIEGTRMVLVQKMDEAREYVVTPYYSRLRPDTQKMVDAIKVLGFDLLKELGSPNSNTLRLPLSKLKVAQEYNKNPRIMVIPTLAELLDGVWPKFICEGIQKIAGIKKCVIVPLMVEGASWGHILYILTKDIPVDILEMIGGHCSQAIKNLIYLNDLERRNSELLALNRIAAIASRSLDMETMLNDTVKEISRIFNADSAVIYLLNTQEQALILTAGHGIPEEWLKSVNITTIPLDSPVMGKFFRSEDNILAGRMDDYAARSPENKHLEDKERPSQYIAAALTIGTVRYGLIVMIRTGSKLFTPEEESILLPISNQIALALENSRLHADVIKRADEAEAARSSLEELYRKQVLTEEKLRESENKYRTIFETANDILVLLDNDGKIIDINRKVKEVGGYSREDLIGKDFKALSGTFTKKSLLILAKNHLKRMAGINVPIYNVDIYTAKGERRTIQISAVAVRREGKITGDLAILRDVTSLKQAEINLKSQKALIDSVLATIPNAVLLLDKDRKVIMANQAFYTLFNIKKGRMDRIRVDSSFIIPELYRLLKESSAGKKEKTSAEMRCAVNSSQKILVVDVFSMKDDNLLAVISDVTEERERRERLYITDRLASVGEMASGVAHELNNPLTSIMGLSGLLVHQDLPDSAKDDLNAINSEAGRCAAIVRNLLAFARKHTLKKEPVQIEKVIKDVLKLRSYEQQGNNIRVETSFPTGIPDVLADYHQMQQVFLNIILNAETAMIDAHGQGLLKISAESHNGTLSLYFQDNGPGIPKENLGLIFNPFFTTKEVGKGTGLGLSIVYGIVTSHGGRIYAKSEYGKGATFIIELPVFKGEKA